MPFFTLFVGLARLDEPSKHTSIVQFALGQIGYGVAIGCCSGASAVGCCDTRTNDVGSPTLAIN